MDRIHSVRVLFALAVLCGDAGPRPAFATDRCARERAMMVEDQIERRGVSDPAVLQAMRTVPRDRFIPADQAPSAYEDRPLPIGFGQTISQPFIVAYMTEIVRPKPGFRVLEIGAGSGYQAAILAEVGGEVYTVEIIPKLAERAKANLAANGYERVQVKAGDGYDGWPEHAPYDAIVVTAAAEHIPPPLIRQLKDGGRMIIPVGSPFLTQYLVLVEKDGDRVITRTVMPVRFVPLRRAEP
jgi:protein-L-isoaspartate(D-aspartate) O-methyltransferase